MMKKLVYLAVFALTLGVCSMAKAVQLVDVPDGHWAEDAVQRLVDDGLIVGYPDGTFRGSSPMTRYEYAMVVSRMMDWIDENYCSPANGKCKSTVAGGDGVSEEQLAEIRSLIDKLAAEFKDELAALKKQVDQNTADIAKTNTRIDNLPLANVEIDGSIRQRLDSPNTDLDNARLGFLLNAVHGLTAPTSLNAGYEMYPIVTFKDADKENNTDWNITLSRIISNQAVTSGVTDATGVAGGAAGGSELSIREAWASIDFSEGVQELDLLKVTSGYQPLTYGYYGALVDNRGLDSTLGVRLDVGKDIVSISGFGGMASMTGNTGSGLGTSTKDPYAAVRVALDLKPVKLGFNYLANGWLKEKGWGVDLEADLLQNTPFLNKVRGEYLTMTDTTTGASPAAAADDASYIVGLDVYTTKKVGVTVSYADIPAIPAFTGVDIAPHTEYDTTCPAAMGLDVNPGSCFNREDSNVIFPAGFKGLGVEASYIVLGDVELAAMAVMGDFAGGSYPAGWATAPGADPAGTSYPGFGKVSVKKPINKNADVKVEYMQQGNDPILFNRVRGELLINF